MIEDTNARKQRSAQVKLALTGAEALVNLGHSLRNPARQSVKQPVSIGRGGIVMARQARTAATAGALAIATAIAGTGASSQEVKPTPKYGNMYAVTQDLLNRAGADGNNFLHTNVH